MTVDTVSGKRCLVLGGGGFIGRHIVEALQRSGAQVRVFGRGLDIFEDSDVEIVTGDFGDTARLKVAIQNIDVVFHLINTTSPATAESNPMFDITTNLVGTVALLSLCKDAGIERVIFASSGGTVYGAVDEFPIREDVLPNPISSYGITKLSLERYLSLYNYSHGMKNIVLRVANPYGPFQTGAKAQGVIGTFMRAALYGEPVKIIGIDSIRDYIYVGDVASAFVAAAEYRGTGHLFNVGTGIGRALRDVVRDVQAVTGIALNSDVLPARRFDVARSVLDVTAARTELHWVADADWNESLQTTWQWVRDYNATRRH